MNALIQTIDGLQELLAVCPCCGEIFRLVEGKFLFPQLRQRESVYTKIVKAEAQLDDEARMLCEEEQALQEHLDEQRSGLRMLGRQNAKNRLKKIDPVFSGQNINPQDVKAIMDPIEYIIFHGHKSDDRCGCIELVSRSPVSKKQEMITKSIRSVVENERVEFETLRMLDDGSFMVKT